MPLCTLLPSALTATTRFVPRRLCRAVISTFLITLFIALALLWSRYGKFGLNVLWRRGGSYWSEIARDEPHHSLAILHALSGAPPVLSPGSLHWTSRMAGFETAELPVEEAGSLIIGQILLARIDPARFQFQVLNDPEGALDLQGWMAREKPVLVVNGSYYDDTGNPATPLISGGRQLGPQSWQAQHGAFVTGSHGARIVDLKQISWQQGFRGAQAGFVSYPLLIGPEGSVRTPSTPSWLADRSFIGQDRSGRILIGTTTTGALSLRRFADFLMAAPLDLVLALNLDGGPLACQAVAAGPFRRDHCGDTEIAVHDGVLQQLRQPWGQRWALPIVLTVAAKGE